MKLKDFVSMSFSVGYKIQFIVTYDQVADYINDPLNCENVISFTSDYKCEWVLNDKISNSEVLEICAMKTDVILIRIKEDK